MGIFYPPFFQSDKQKQVVRDWIAEGDNFREEGFFETNSLFGYFTGQVRLEGGHEVCGECCKYSAFFGCFSGAT